MEIGSGTGVGAVFRRGTGDEDAGIAVVEIVMSDEDVGIIGVGGEKSIGPVGKGRESRLKICVSVDLLSGEKRFVAGAETVPIVLGQRPVGN